MTRRNCAVTDKLSLHDSEGIIPCVEITRPAASPGMYCIWRLSEFDITSELDDLEDGAEIVVKLRLMTEEEINALPDFEGW